MLKRYVVILISLIGLSACSNPSSTLGSFIGFITNVQAQWASTPHPAAYTRPEVYPNISIGPLQYVPTTTGNSLAVRVTVPADKNGVPITGRFPVILVQSAYNVGVISSIGGIAGGGFLGAPDPFMVKRGYIIVGVDVMGTGASEGGWELIGAEEQKGYGDVVDWIQRQPWAGNIGVSGVSYMAISALLTAQQRPDAIKAVFASGSLGDAMRGTAATGGMMNATILNTWLSLTHTASTLNDTTKQQFPDLAAQIDRATQRHIEQIDKFYLPIVNGAMQGDPKIIYGEFGRIRSPLENMAKIKAPTFLSGSLTDLFQRDTPLLYESLKNRVDTRLMMFDGTHISGLGQAILGTDKTDPLPNLLLQWFDKYLLGMNTGIERIPRVTQFVRNYKSQAGQSFSTTTDWPHPAAVPQRWYLHGDGNLNPFQPIWTENARTMKAAKDDTSTFGKSADGKQLNLVTTINDGTQCSVSASQWTLGFANLTSLDSCFTDDGKIEQGALNYQTAPMLTDYYINGPIQADVWVSSTVTDAVISVRVDEVTVFGNVVPLSNGLLIASARAVDESRSRYIRGIMVQPYLYLDPAKEKPLVPGQVTKLQIEIFPTSALVRAGSRLRVSISPSNQAQGILSLPQRARAKNGVTTIHNSAAYPSSVVVLAVPLNQLN
jgi:uncharacterized protein